MRNLFAVLALIPALAFGATTFTTDTTYDAGFVRVSVATCTTGTEATPSGATVGLDLQGVKGYAVFVEGSAAMTAGGKLLAHLYNPITSRWTPAPDLDITVAAVQYQGFAGFAVTSDFSRVAYVPSGVGTACAAAPNQCKIYLIARRLPASLTR